MEFEEKKRQVCYLKKWYENENNEKIKKVWYFLVENLKCILQGFLFKLLNIQKCLHIEENKTKQQKIIIFKIYSKKNNFWFGWFEIGSRLIDTSLLFETY